MITSIEGVRGTLSYVEYKCGYRHSHLQGKSEFENSPTFSSFCLGTGDYAETQRTWLEGKEFNQEDFELLLYQTGAYVRWESLGGGPYFRMENIAVGGTNTYVSGIDHHFRNIVKYLNSFPMKFDYTTKRFVISRDQIEDVLSGTESDLDIPRIKKTSAGEEILGKEGKQNWFKAGLAAFGFVESVDTTPSKLKFDETNKYDMKKLPVADSETASSNGTTATAAVSSNSDDPWS